MHNDDTPARTLSAEELHALETKYDRLNAEFGSRSRAAADGDETPQAPAKYYTIDGRDQEAAAERRRADAEAHRRLTTGVNPFVRPPSAADLADHDARNGLAAGTTARLLDEYNADPALRQTFGDAGRFLAARVYEHRLARGGAR